MSDTRPAVYIPSQPGHCGHSCRREYCAGRRTPMAVAANHRVLSDDILARCAERAPVYDRENRFFTEDFEELRQAGYLRMVVPEALGGMGMSLAQVCQEQRRLAYHAAPTALAIN